MAKTKPAKDLKTAPSTTGSEEAADKPAAPADDGKYNFTWGKTLPAHTQRRLNMLSRSALAGAMSDEFDLLPYVPPRGEVAAKRLREHQDDLLNKIKQQCQEIDGLGKGLDGLDWSALTLSRAVSLNALGRGLHRVGRNRDALAAFNKAILLLPDYLDAYLHRANIRLGDLPRSAHMVEEDLKLALSQSPSNQKAHFLMGKLLSHPSVARYGEAKVHLKQADLYPIAFLIHAEILVEQEGNLAEGIEVLQQSLALNSQPDRRAVRFVEYVLSYTKIEARSEAPASVKTETPAPATPIEGTRSPEAADVVHPAHPAAVHEARLAADKHELLVAAERVAQSLVRGGTPARFAEQGESLLLQVHNRLSELGPAPTAIPPDETDKIR